MKSQPKSRARPLMEVLRSKTGPGVGRKECWCVAEQSVKTSLKGPTDAADDLAGSTPGTLEDVASWGGGGGREERGVSRTCAGK